MQGVATLPAEAAENTACGQVYRADFEALRRSAMPAIAHGKSFHYIVMYRG